MRTRKQALRFGSTLVVLLAGALNALTLPPSDAAADPGATTAARVSVGSPSGLTPQNVQNEATVAVDPNDPNLVIAGAHDFLDQQPCPQQLAVQTARCADLNDMSGVSGVYFSFDRGRDWIQPTYTGWTRRDCSSAQLCAAYFGPIGTVPSYYEAGLYTYGFPSLAVGPRPVDGKFSWANGSRAYYATLVRNLPGSDTLGGTKGVAVSWLDNPTPSSVLAKSSWMSPVVISANQSSTDLADQEQFWVDNAASSPYFGRAYACFPEFRSNGLPPRQTTPAALMIGTSADGGSTWDVRQAAAAGASGNGPNLNGLTFCSVRTDSHGVVYAFVEADENPAFSGLPTHGTELLMRSFDGGATWTKPRALFDLTDPCFFIDQLINQCVMDGYTGAREHGQWAKVDIANGAPTGADATNPIIISFVDASAGLNNEHAVIAYSLDSAQTWHGPTAVSLPGDRAMYSAPALSPNGDRAYVVYEAETSPWAGTDTGTPRPYHGVLLTAPFGPNGPGTWTTAYDGPTSDLRATYSGHRLIDERIGDFVGAAATRGYGIGVWDDARNATVCNPIQTWRSASISAGSPVTPAPWPTTDCPATFGNTKVWAATTG
jgi:hypothetical protein